jgi:hypothetical protein
VSEPPPTLDCRPGGIAIPKKISPAAALAAWAVGTAWLLLFIVLERSNDALGESLVDWIQGVSAVLMAPLYLPFRKWFAAWLKKAREPS